MSERAAPGCLAFNGLSNRCSAPPGPCVPEALAPSSLATGCNHGSPQPALSQGACSLDGAGFVSTRTFTISTCDTSFFHLGGIFTGNCGGHNGDTYRLLATGANDCYAY